MRESKRTESDDLIPENSIRMIKHLRDNQKYEGLEGFKEIQEQLRYCGASLVEISENKDSCLANILASVNTIQSILDIQIGKLKVAYRKEGDELKKSYELINSH